MFSLVNNTIIQDYKAEGAGCVTCQLLKCLQAHARKLPLENRRLETVEVGSLPCPDLHVVGCLNFLG